MEIINVYSCAGICFVQGVAGFVFAGEDWMPDLNKNVKNTGIREEKTGGEKQKEKVTKLRT